MFVFRNYTIERFFPDGYHFSGYDDISHIPEDEDGYVWFYQPPLGVVNTKSAKEIDAFLQKFLMVVDSISPTKMIVALTMEQLYSVTLSENDYQLREAITRYNDGIIKASRTHQNIKVIDFSEFTTRYPLDELVDWKFYFISQMSPNPRLSTDFKKWFAMKVDQIAMKRKKCLVLDLDNTLWGGILGEDGLEGIKIGGDYPGNAFLCFQQGLLELSMNGVLLAACSKNNEQDVLELWERNPFIVLRKEHFAAYRINWHDKASNLKELADELNIGLESFVFVDDDRTERELIKQMLPMVAVPDFPLQPYNIPQFYKALVNDYFKVYAVTDEDKTKTEQYRANALRKQAGKSFVNLDEFLENLEIHLVIEKANNFNVPRIAQLTQKTNQFNLTSRRYTDTDIKERIAAGWQIWCMSVSDRFGDSGITGCIMMNGNEIDTLLLSCRILGKDIEYAFIKTILRLLKEQKLSSVTARYIPTAKNAQVNDFYDRCGFCCVSKGKNGEKTYVLKLDEIDLKIKKHYKIGLK